MTTLSIAANNFDLTAQEFCDALAVHYKKPIVMIAVPLPVLTISCLARRVALMSRSTMSYVMLLVHCCGGRSGMNLLFQRMILHSNDNSNQNYTVVHSSNNYVRTSSLLCSRGIITLQILHSSNNSNQNCVTGYTVLLAASKNEKRDTLFNLLIGLLKGFR